MATIIAAVDDLFFVSRIRAAAEHLGVSVKFVRSDNEALEAVNEQPALIILDLQSSRISSVDLGRRIKNGERSQSMQVIGFLSHVETELKRAAEDAGFDAVLPRSAFTNQLGAILSGQFKG